MTEWHDSDFITCGNCDEIYFKSQGACPVCDWKPKNINETTVNESVQSSLPVKIGKRNRSQRWLYKGHKLGSTKELNRFMYLENLQERGIISQLDTQTQEIIMHPVLVPRNPLFEAYEQIQENYTADFLYYWRGYWVYEDVKDKRFTPKKRQLKPKMTASSATKCKALQEILSKRIRCIFMYSVFHNGIWHYFNTNLDESEIELD